MATGEIADCSIGNGKDPQMKAPATPIERDHCHTRIPATVAIGFEGAEYFHHLCRPLCIEAWCKATNAHGR